jgi:hypothetical protein
MIRTRYGMDILPVSSTWQEFLKVLGKSCELKFAYTAMQQRFPGPYTLQQRYDSDKGGYYYTLEWENLADRTMWLLRWT